MSSYLTCCSTFVAYLNVTWRRFACIEFVIHSSCEMDTAVGVSLLFSQFMGQAQLWSSMCQNGKLCRKFLLWPTQQAHPCYWFLDTVNASTTSRTFLEQTMYSNWTMFLLPTVCSRCHWYCWNSLPFELEWYCAYTLDGNCQLNCVYQLGTVCQNWTVYRKYYPDTKPSKLKNIVQVLQG